MRRVGQARKRDANEGAIVDALEAHGARCWRISGKGCPDLLVAFRGRFMALEVKSAKGRLTEAQADIPWPVVRSVDEAIREVTNGR